MPFISEAASAIKRRFGFQDSASEPITSVRSSPNLLKLASKESILQSSAIRSIRERDDYGPGTASFEFQDDPSFWKDHNVQVIIRVRPLSNSELSQQGPNKCVRQDSCQTITWIGHPESRFTFDLVADENVSQEMLFKVAGVQMVENCMGGYNSCMFAYGQTGSGKTHTMLGDIEEGTRRHSVNCGMTPRVFEYLFSRIQKEKEAHREEKLGFICRCSFLEIYNEQILDLLDPSSTNLQIREDIKKGVYVENLTEVEVKSARDVIQQLVQRESQGVTRHRFARLNLVDLAGSERQKSSGAEGERLKEATNINKSLSTLGLVIMNLVSVSNGKSFHVPYRDSKLTFLLQDSLGGNSKTIIIANISPSTCCSLETLSTLKFAQRAKFIKNNAIVNEDASGDVIAMRMQIQQLKKEVARLQSLVNNEGAESHEIDASTVSFTGSPGSSYKWEGVNGSFSPFTTDKRMSRKNDYEVALVGAFRREKDKGIALQSLAAENQAAMQLAKQREAEIQGLKMRLKFREAGIKRLEEVAAGKMSAEMHLLKEKEEHLKELEVLRIQADRNQDVTRFAMENLHLKEEIRRLKSFYEEGECERMNEQIMILENKLLEALDWKFMHESDPSIQKGSSNLAIDIQNDSSLLTSSQEPASPWCSSINEENEFLRMQAIHNQSELDALRKMLDACISEKDKLERHVADLVKELDEERSSKTALDEPTVKSQIDFTSLATDHMGNITLSDQMELKTMVDAIATASQREAEAHEMAIILSKENDELKMKFKVLIEDNNRLIELYERIVAENKDSHKAQNCQNECTDVNHSNNLSQFLEREVELKKDVEVLQQQLREMHEENEKLMDLYEQVMQAKNYEKGCTEDASNQLSEFVEKEVKLKKDVETLEQQLKEMHEENEKLMDLYEQAMQAKNSEKEYTADHSKCLSEFVETELRLQKDVETLEQQLQEMHEENGKLMELYEQSMQAKNSEKECENHNKHLSEFVEKEMKLKKVVKTLEQELRQLREENEKLMDLYEQAMQAKNSEKECTEVQSKHLSEFVEKELKLKKDVETLEQHLREMQEENEKLMDLYEQAMQAKNSLTECTEDQSNNVSEFVEKEVKLKNDVETLEHQLREMHEENEKLIGLYNQAMQKECTEYHRNHLSEFVEKEIKLKDVEMLEHELNEMHEENDKLTSLYKQATQERDVFKRMISSDGWNRLEVGNGESHYTEKLLEVVGGAHLNFDKPLSGQEKIIGEENHLFGAYDVNRHECICELEKSACCGLLGQDACDETESGMSMAKTVCSRMNIDDRVNLHSEVCGGVAEVMVGDNDLEMEVKSSSVATVELPENVNLMRSKLNKVQEDLLKSAQTVGSFGPLGRAVIDIGKLSREIEALEVGLQLKQDDYASSKLLFSEMQERIALAHRKFMALKYSLSSFSKSTAYFEQREAQARARVNDSLSYLNKKKEELANLQASKDEIEGTLMKIQHSKAQLKKSLADLKSKIEEENRRRENEKVLFPIDNVERTDIHGIQRNWNLSGKATELLVSEEYKTKLQTEVKQGQEKLGAMRKQIEDLNKEFEKLESLMQNVQKEIIRSLKSVEELNHRLQSVTQEKEMVLEMKENGRTEFENMVLEYHQHLFEADLKDEELKILAEELQFHLRKVAELQTAKTEAGRRITQLLEVKKCPSYSLSDKMAEELHNVQTSVMELKVID